MSQKVTQFPPKSHSSEPEPPVTKRLPQLGLGHCLTEASELFYRKYFTLGENTASKMSADLLTLSHQLESNRTGLRVWVLP